MRARLPSLEGVTLMPPPGASWRSVAAVAATVLDAGVPGYAVSLAQATAPMHPCDMGVGVEELTPEDLHRRF